MTGALRIVAAVCVLLGAAGCSIGRSPLGTGGTPDPLEQSAAGFQFEAAPVALGDSLGVELRVQLAPADLAFVRRDTTYEAAYSVVFRLYDSEGGALRAGLTLNDTLRAVAYADTRALEPIAKTALLAMPAGSYLAEATLQRPGSHLLGSRLALVSWESSYTARAEMTPITLLREAPVIGAHVPQEEGPLWAEASVLGASAGEVLAAHLLRHPAPIHPALPPHVPVPVAGVGRPVPVAGVGRDVLMRERAQGDTLWTGTFFIEQARRMETARFVLPEVGQGLYTLTVEAVGAPALRSTRRFALLPPGYPALQSLDALIEPLVYIASEEELDAIRQAEDPAERRRRFDAFWGSLFDDRRSAETTLRRYYERVETANRLFTSYKPGWMTDRGMIYVVLGPPEAVEQTTSGEVWHYAAGDPTRTFRFERLEFPQEAALEALALVRGEPYERGWRRAVQRWRRGEVL